MVQPCPVAFTGAGMEYLRMAARQYGVATLAVE